MKPEIKRRAVAITTRLASEQERRGALKKELCGDDIELHLAVEKLCRQKNIVLESGTDRPDVARVETVRPVTPNEFSTVDPQSEFATRGPEAIESGDNTLPAWISRFLPERILGRGGQGEVWLALDPQLGRQVALKIVKPGLRNSEGSIAKFKWEAEVTGQLEHPNIVPIYEAGSNTSDGSPFYVMRVLREKSLQVAIDEFHRARSLTLDLYIGGLRQLLNRFVDICEAMAYAHSRGVIHRDLKPENVMLGEFGETLVADWGMAKIIGEDEFHSGFTDFAPQSRDSATQEGTVKGTPQYMSPEQARGEVKLLDSSTDIYSLGAILYCLLTGQPPIATLRKAQDRLAPDRDQTVIQPPSLQEVLSRVRRGDIPKPSAVQPFVPNALEAICLKALAMKPRQRYRTAADNKPAGVALANDIKHWLNDEPTSAWKEPRRVRLRRWVGRHQTAVATTAVAGLLILFSLATVAALVSRHNQVLGGKNLQLDGLNRTLDGVNRTLDGKNQELSQALIRETEATKIAKSNEVEAIRQEKLAKAETVKTRDTLINLFFERGRTFHEQGDYAREAATYNYLCDLIPDSDWRATSARNLLGGCINQFGEWISVPAGRDGMASPVAFSKDWQFVEWGDKRWDLRTGHRISELNRSAGPSIVTCSRDGLVVAAGMPDNSVRLWNVETAQPRGVLMKHPQPVIDIGFSPDGKTVLTASRDRIVRLWNSSTGRDLEVALQHDVEVTSASFSTDGKVVITVTTFEGTRPPAIHFWNAKTGARLGPIQPIQPAVNQPPFHTTGNLVLVLGLGGKPVLIDARTGMLYGKPVVHDQPVVSVEFKAGGKSIRVHRQDGSLRIWDFEAGLIREDETQNSAGFRQVAASPEGHRILGIGNGGIMQIVDVRQFKAIGRAMVHGGQVPSLESFSYAYSPCGLTIATGSRNRTVRLWNAFNGDPIGDPLLHPRPVERVGFSPDGRTLYSIDKDGAVRLWNAPMAALHRKEIRHRGPVLAIAFSPDGRTLMTTGGDHTARIWDFRTGMPIGAAMQHGQPIVAIRFAPDGKTVLTGTFDGVVRSWDAATGREIRVVLRADTQNTNRMAFSHDAKSLVALRSMNEFQIWDLTTGKPRGLPVKREIPFSSLTISSDGQTVLEGGAEGVGRIWDSKSRSVKFELKAHQQPIIVADLSPNGKFALSGSRDNVVRLWDVELGKEPFQRIQHDEIVTSVAFSSDSQTALTASVDGTIRSWNVQTGAPLGASYRNGGIIIDIDVSPDGRLAATGDERGAVRIWDITTPVPRSADWRRALVRLRTGYSTDETGKIIELETQERLAQWPIALQHGGLWDGQWVELTHWHDSQATIAEEIKNWFAARFHLARLAALLPDKPQVMKRLGAAEKAWQKSNADWHGSVAPLPAK